MCISLFYVVGIFTVRLPKATNGQHFEGLDMLSKLLAPVGSHEVKQPVIEVLDGGVNLNTFEIQSVILLNVLYVVCTSCCVFADANADEIDDSEEFDWQIEQQPFFDAPVAIDCPKYGFANQRSGVFQRLQARTPFVIFFTNITQSYFYNTIRKTLFLMLRIHSGSRLNYRCVVHVEIEFTGGAQ